MSGAILRGLILSTASIAVFASTAAWGSSTKHYTFGNHSSVKVKLSGRHKLLSSLGVSTAYFTDGASRKTSQLVTSVRVPIRLVPSDSQSLNQLPGIMLVNGPEVFLLGATGKMYRTKIAGEGLISWRGIGIKFGKTHFFVYSFLTNAGKTFTSIMRFSDGATATYSNGYYNFENSVPGVSADGLLTIDENLPAVDLNHFDQAVKTSRAAALREIAQPSKSAALRDQTRIRDIVAGHLNQKVFGQRKLISRLAHYVVNPPVEGRPVVLVITGPSGVGKTLVGERFADEVFGDQKYFLEIDGTEYMSPVSQGNIESHKLFGAPLGQQGMQKGILTSWLSANDGDGVLVINEGDKMHPDMWKRLMELLDRGVVTSGAGIKIKSRKLYIVITSNRGAAQMFPPSIDSWSQEEIDLRLASLDSDTVKASYSNKVSANDKGELPVEVTNRVREYLVAGPISRETAVEIANSALTDFNAASAEEYAVRFSLTPDALKYLALTNFLSTKDGRWIRDQVQHSIETARTLAGAAWPLSDGTTLELGLTANEDGDTQMQVSWLNPAGQRLHADYDAPQTKSENPVADPRVREILARIEPTLNARIIGQPHAVKSVAEAIRSKLSDGFRKHPVSIFLAGSTGTGKTETGRAIAEAIYGSADRLEVVTLGNIRTEPNFSKVFGADPGHIGSDSVREFEKALIKNPEGGVIVFDEASNMGGSDKDKKAEFFKLLYEMTEEGKWTSPTASAKVYDLSKYVFVFTGNDGERLFHGVTSDDMRLAIWKQNSSRAKVKTMLLESGVPEAFIMRMADTILMKPLTRAEMDRVVIKLFNQTIQKTERQYKGAKVTIAPSLITQIADSFFLSEGGGRSIRTILEDRLPGLVSAAFVASGLNLKRKLDGVELELTLTDSLTKKPYLRKGSPARLVKLTAQVKKAGKVISEDFLDLTELATAKRFMGARGAKSTAFHEAGHAVVNDESVTAEKMVYVTIEGGTFKQNGENVEYLGVARYEPIEGQGLNPTRRTTVIRIAQLFAGRLAQEMAGYEYDRGWENDKEKIQRIAADALLKWGVEPRLLSVRLDEKGQPILNADDEKFFKAKMDELLAEGRSYAHKTLVEKWPLVRAMTAELLIKGNINNLRFKEIESKIEANSRSVAPTARQEFVRSSAARIAGIAFRCEDLFKAGQLP